MPKRARAILNRFLRRYAAAGYPLLPITRLLRGPIRWFYHCSPLLRHDSKTYLKPYLLENAHEWLIRRHPRDFMIYRKRIRFRSFGSLMSVQAYYVGEIEFHLVRFVVNLLQPDFTMLDVGAHHGVFTVVVATEMRARGWEGLIHSFEPHPQNFSLLQHNVSENHLEAFVRLHRQAVGDVEGKARLLIRLDENSDNALDVGVTSPGSPGMDRCDVDVATLDSLYDSVLKVHLIKIDVQGGEPRVLKGAEKIIRRDRPILIVEAVQGWDGTSAIKEFLLDHSYSIYGVDSSGRLCDVNSPAAYVSWDWVGLPS